MPNESFETIQVDDAKIVYRRIGNGCPLLVLNGFAATIADWDPLFIHGLASSNELILLDNRGIGSSTDGGKPFDIARLADDAARVIGDARIRTYKHARVVDGRIRCADAGLAAPRSR